MKGDPLLPRVVGEHITATSRDGSVWTRLRYVGDDRWFHETANTDGGVSIWELGSQEIESWKPLVLMEVPNPLDHDIEVSATTGHRYLGECSCGGWTMVNTSHGALCKAFIEHVLADWNLR